MTHWYMLTLVGRDQPGIVARLTAALYDGGCNLGAASMLRLAGNFTIMLMAQHEGTTETLVTLVEPVAQALDLHLHVDRIEAHLHQHLEPDVRITVHSADRAGIVAQVTAALADAGLNILDLESDLAGSTAQPIYVLHIEGLTRDGVEVLRTALVGLAQAGIEVRMEPIETMLG